MGEIFFILGAWLMVSGIKDIRTSLKIKDSYEYADEAYEESVDNETFTEGSAVA